MSAGSARSLDRHLNQESRPDQGASSNASGNFILRILSALVLGPLVLVCVWMGDLWFAVLIAVMNLACSGEWRKMANLESRGVGTILILGPLFVLVAAVEASPAAGLFTLAIALFLAAATFGSPWSERIWAITALFHIGLAILALIFLRETPVLGRDLVFLLFGAVWLSDIGGYVAGRLIGGPRLAPAISPNKTWAGALGALTFVTIGVLLLVNLTTANALVYLLIGLLLSVATQAGDLFESWVKRMFGVKDSGTLIPGHGGVLDRVDGVLFAAPVLVVFVLVIGTDLMQWQ